MLRRSRCLWAIVLQVVLLTGLTMHAARATPRAQGLDDCARASLSIAQPCPMATHRHGSAPPAGLPDCCTHAASPDAVLPDAVTMPARRPGTVWLVMTLLSGRMPGVDRAPLPRPPRHATL